VQRTQFVRMAKVFPLADMLEFRVDADVYRVAVGVSELVCGAVLAMIPGMYFLVTFVTVRR